MQKNWLIIYDSENEFVRAAAERVKAEITEHIGTEIPETCSDKKNSSRLCENNLVFVGIVGGMAEKELKKAGGILPEKEQSYTVKVCENPYNADFKAIYIVGNDERGVMYAAADFKNKYCGEGVFKNSRHHFVAEDFFTDSFNVHLPVYEISEAPAFKERGIWTWGHCIYDYRRFFGNMLSLKLNLAVIWNDFAPINAKEIVDFAHSLGIKIVWGFSWGWSTNCKKPGFKIDDDVIIDEWAQKILSSFESDYLSSGADGIYFQSFTETGDEEIDGVCIAQAVVKWVNRISDTLLRNHPDLQIQFGLHASSVKEKLQYIKETDPRVRIVWEDCGAFPYGYSPWKVESFDETLKLNEKICTLRGENEKFGAVLKGMSTLDWTRFSHMTKPITIGKKDREFVKNRAAEREKMWKFIQAYWLKYGKYALKMIEEISRHTKNEAVMQMLVEDGCFEENAYFPVALCAQMLWNPSVDFEDLLCKVALFPETYFANEHSQN